MLDLLGENPFPESPPRYVRLRYYLYHFTDLQTKRETGAWWKREHVGLLTAPVSLPETPAEPERR